jgi:hypothetical protein
MIFFVNINLITDYFLSSQQSSHFLLQSQIFSPLHPHLQSLSHLHSQTHPHLQSHFSSVIFLLIIC